MPYDANNATTRTGTECMSEEGRFTEYKNWVKTEAVKQCDCCGAYINRYGLARDYWDPLIHAPWDKGDPMPHLASFFGIT